MEHRRPDVRLAVTLAVGVASGLLLAGLVQGILIRVYDLLITVLLSLFVSFAFEPAVQWLSDRGVRRGWGTAMVFFAAFLAVAGFVAAMAPLIVDQTTMLVQQGPTVLGDLADQARNLPGTVGESVAAWLDEQRTELPQRLPEIAPEVVGGALGFGQTLLGNLLQLLTALLISFYLVADGPRLRRTLSARMGPERQREFLDWWNLAIAKTGGYLYSRLLTAVASAIFHIAVFTTLGLPYAIALGVWVGLVSSVIPVIGTYLAGALPVLITLADSPGDALWVLVAIVVYQQVENYLVAPRINAHALSLHPAVAFAAVLFGAALLGPAGALLALPATAIVAALISAQGERHEVVDHGLTTEQARDVPRRRATDRPASDSAAPRRRGRRATDPPVDDTDADDGTSSSRPDGPAGPA